MSKLMSELSCGSNLFPDQTLACSLSPHSVSVIRTSYRMFSWGGNSQVNQCVKRTAHRKEAMGVALGGAMGVAWWDVIGYHTIYP